MKISKACLLLTSFFVLSSCSQVEYEKPQQRYFHPLGAYRAYGDVADLRYYKPVLPTRKWRDTRVLNYSEGYFAFPPLSGHQIMHYYNPRHRTEIELRREVIGENITLADVVSRRRVNDHCRFINTVYRQEGDIEILEVTANHYIWLYGDYRCKYYFLRTGNVIYTFRLLSPSEGYLFFEPDFDLFTDNAINNYLVYSPRQQLSPVPSQYAIKPLKGRGLSDLFSKLDLISFFAPVATRHTVPQ